MLGKTWDTLYLGYISLGGKGRGSSPLVDPRGFISEESHKTLRLLISLLLFRFEEDFFETSFRRKLTLPRRARARL